MSYNYKKHHRMDKMYEGKFNLVHVPESPEIFYDIPGWPGYKISRFKNVYSEKGRCVLKQYQSFRAKPQKHVILINKYGQKVKVNITKLFWKTFYMPDFLRKTPSNF